jgi:hypothetical protein
MSRFQFFSQLAQWQTFVSAARRHGDCQDALTLMSTIVDPVVVDTRDGSVVADVERHAYVVGVSYEVRKREQSAAELESATGVVGGRHARLAARRRSASPSCRRAWPRCAGVVR